MGGGNSLKAVWTPTRQYIESTRLFRWMSRLGFTKYEDFLKASTDDIAWFWQEAEKELGIVWNEPYKQVLQLERGIMWPNWYVDGRMNIVSSALERWANNPKTAQNPALIWEGEQGHIRQFSYKQLHEDVCRVANGLRREGLQKGDIISIFMPMIPETVLTILASAKLGAICLPVFSGYGADAIANRLNSAKAKFLVTADGFYRRGKKINMKEQADLAADKAPSLEKVIVVRSINSEIDRKYSRDIEWQKIFSSEPLYETCMMPSNAPLMLLYTSGTTGTPKGAVHTHSGFPIKAAFDAGIAMDVTLGDRLFWYTDMGWMMGPFLVFGGLINGASIMMYDGVPDFPTPGRLWELTEKHQVTHLGISPTLVRALMKHGEDWPQKYNLSCLRVIGSTGEPWNPEPWKWLFESVGKGRIPIFNYSGGTEISGGILGNVLVRPIAPIAFNSPIPGMDVEVLDDEGIPVTGSVGELVVMQPWVGMTAGFWNEPERFVKSYWSRWKNIWVHGDWVYRDANGYWKITGRSDDTLNIAGKRMGPAEMESIIVEHPLVVEAGTIGIPDQVKGEVAVCFVVAKDKKNESESLRNDLLQLIATKLGKALSPKAIYFVSDLPKTRNAKIMRRVIKSAYLGKDSGDLSALENPKALLEIRELGENSRL
ncbi:AMP-binding protein [Bacillus marasmi]|uniref:AMP-binding protein n=1 Tax=Bacillus marasmi TaxID=1926279 RepID=UPI0011CC4EE7|nr:AMP-binding protein [Bacillus marasmi]